MIYVVEDDHAILYAGKSFKLARAVMKGNGCVSAWNNGKWIGDVGFDKRWIFKTKWHPDNAPVDTDV